MIPLSGGRRVSESGRPVLATVVEAVKLDKTSFSDAAAMVVVVVFVEGSLRAALHMKINLGSLWPRKPSPRLLASARLPKVDSMRACGSRGSSLAFIRAFTFMRDIHISRTNKTMPALVNISQSLWLTSLALV